MIITICSVSVRKGLVTGCDVQPSTAACLTPEFTGSDHKRHFPGARLTGPLTFPLAFIQGVTGHRCTRRPCAHLCRVGGSDPWLLLAVWWLVRNELAAATRACVTKPLYVGSLSPHQTSRAIFLILTWNIKPGLECCFHVVC